MLLDFIAMSHFFIELVLLPVVFKTSWATHPLSLPAGYRHVASALSAQRRFNRALLTHESI